MPVAQKNRDQLRSALLGPLGQEATDMLMEEINQSALRDHVDGRFDTMRAYIDGRFDTMKAYIDQRFEQVDRRFEQLEAKIDRLAVDIREAAHPGNALVYTVCGTLALVAVTALATVLIQAFGG